jgi:hypothetical protein
MVFNRPRIKHSPTRAEAPAGEDQLDVLYHKLGFVKDFFDTNWKIFVINIVKMLDNA